MTPLDEGALREMLGELRAYVLTIKEQQASFIGQCRLCRCDFDERLRSCETGLARSTAIASFVAMLAALVPQWIRWMWR